MDGDEVARTVVDEDGGRCAEVEPANDDPYEFAAPQPCPLDVAGAVAFDTASLTDGAHTVRVSVEDAAGNVAVVHEGVVRTHNAPVALTAPALSGAARSGAQLIVGNGAWSGAPTGFGRRWLRCAADGTRCTGIAGADGAAYTLTAADAYHRVVAEVTAENASGAATARSAPSALVADAAGRTSPPPGGTTAQSSGGIAGLTNPLGQLPGHVGNGTPASGHARIELAFRLAGSRTAQRVRSPRNRRWTLVGRLVGDDGRGIGNARLIAAWKVDGRAWTARGGVRTGADGRFAYLLAPGPSRAVKLTYFAFSDSRTFVASNVVQEDVLAPVTIRTDRRFVTGGRVVRLSGRVGGKLIPRSGVLVTLQGYQPGWGWRTFRTVRTTRSGRWSTRYRFRLSHGRFGFRAIVPRQAGYPFLTSRSTAVHVTVA